MNFYHEIKKHMSPSALDQWKRQRSAFVSSYFEQKEKVDTKAMQAGRQIHKLIEAGLIKAKKVYKNAEQELIERVPGSEYDFMGIPDSWEKKGKKLALFVDYKSGKANDWKEKLPVDIKMKATAWLVWMMCDKPEIVKGAIEFIQTTWDPEAKAVVPIDGKESEVVEITYDAEDMEHFTRVIIESMNEVNEAYEKWLKGTDAFINQDDIAKYERLNVEKSNLEKEMDEIKERIKTQMEFGGLLNVKTPAGTFYITERKTFDYPANLKIKYLDMGLVLEDAEAIGSAAKAAQKNYELLAEPISQSTSIGFRPAKAK